MITWNMHGGRGDLPRLVDDLASGRLTGVPPLAYALLLQEAVDDAGDPSSTLARVQGRGLSTVFAPVREVDGVTSGNAMIASVGLDRPRTIRLPRERQSRGAVVATIAVRDVRLFLVSTHFENRSSWRQAGLFADAARGRQAAALIAELPLGPGIVGGDLNTWLGPAEPAWQRLLRRFPDTPPIRRHSATFAHRLVLDHLFFDLPDGWMAERLVLPESYGSDHSPVLGIIHQTARSQAAIAP